MLVDTMQINRLGGGAENAGVENAGASCYLVRTNWSRLQVAIFAVIEYVSCNKYDCVLITSLCWKLANKLADIYKHGCIMLTNNPPKAATILQQ